MIEIDGDFPFLWRLSAESKEGFCAVSMVVPYQADNLRRDLTIETPVVSLASDSTRSEHEEVLEWNQDDIELFLKLVNYRRHMQNLPLTDTVQIDLADPTIIEIIHLVAAAGFGTAYSANGVLHQTDSRFPVYHFQVGAHASLNTVSGFKPCVIVAMEDDDVVCVLLDDMDLIVEDEFDQLHRHDLLLVKRVDVLHPDFTTLNVELEPRILH
jgi:hypothetical protein